MIKVRIGKSKTGEYKLVQAVGHAGYAESGNDVVCAAVSMLFINTLNAMEALAGDGERMRIVTNEEEGLIDCRFDGSLSEGSILLLDTLVLGLEDVARQYPKKYFRLITEEV